jgi:hypothetical protein
MQNILTSYLVMPGLNRMRRPLSLVKHSEHPGSGQENGILFGPQKWNSSYAILSSESPEIWITKYFLSNEILGLHRQYL